MEDTTMPLRELIDKAKERLQELQYSPATIKLFSRYWREILEYADEKQIQYFTVMLGEDYLRDVCHIDMAEDTRASNLPSWRVNPPKRAVYLLADFQNSGSILRKIRGNHPPIPSCFSEMTEHFYAVCRSRYNSESTIQSKKFTVERFLWHLEQQGIQSVEEIKEVDSRQCWARTLCCRC